MSMMNIAEPAASASTIIVVQHSTVLNRILASLSSSGKLGGQEVTS